jgi:hypothetical protein
MVSMTQPEQSYCDWCYSTPNEEDRTQSRKLGFDVIQTWTCIQCITTNRISIAPRGWESPWPADQK